MTVCFISSKEQPKSISLPNLAWVAVGKAACGELTR